MNEIICRVLVLSEIGGGFVAYGLEYGIVARGKNWAQTERAFARSLISNILLRESKDYAKKLGIEGEIKPIKEAPQAIWDAWNEAENEIRAKRHIKLNSSFSEGVGLNGLLQSMAKIIPNLSLDSRVA